MMVGEPIFGDTNILIYASQKQSTFHVPSVAWLERSRHGDQELWISRQVMREYLSAVTRPQPDQAPLPMMQAIEDVQGFDRDFNVADDGPQVFIELLQLLTRFPAAGKQVHDANLVATMAVCGVARLLTFNTADFRRFSPIIEIVSP